MNKYIKGELENFIKNDFIWKLIRPFALVGSKIIELRNKITAPPKASPTLAIPTYFESLEVLHGPFKGMKYPKTQAIGSAIFPKLMGSYESEIHSNIEDLLSFNNYSEIVDVGCAEGYYAVGMAMRSTESKIYAFDTNEDARDLCLEMAKLNSIEAKVHVNSELTPDKLNQFEFTGKGLIICDCEGYETILFNKTNLSNLLNCDLIIETHDFKNIEISTYIKNLFYETHDLQSVYSVDDIQKALTYKYPELKSVSLSERKRIFSEWRPAIMEWVICTPKKIKNKNY